MITDPYNGGDPPVFPGEFLRMKFMKPVLAATLVSSSALLAQQPAAPLQYPAAHTVEQVDDYFGAKVSDPYRWM